MYLNNSRVELFSFIQNISYYAGKRIKCLSHIIYNCSFPSKMIADFLHASIVNRIVLVRSTINKCSIMEVEETLIFETILPSRHRVIHLVHHD